MSNLRPNLATLMVILSDLADAEVPMIDNRQIAARIPCALATVNDLLTDLRRADLISIDYTPNGLQRRVRILATGARTGWQERQAWRGHKAKVVRPKAGQPKAFMLHGATHAAGLSNSALYGDLADAMLTCRRAGDVVYRVPGDPQLIRLNNHVVDGKGLRDRALRHCLRDSHKG